MAQHLTYTDTAGFAFSQPRLALVKKQPVGGLVCLFALEANGGPRREVLPPRALRRGDRGYGA